MNFHASLTREVMTVQDVCYMRRSTHGKPTGGIWLRPAYHIGTMMSLISRFRQARPVISSRMINHVT